MAIVAFFGAGSGTVAVLGEQLARPLVLLAAAAIGSVLAPLVQWVTLRARAASAHSGASRTPA